jgi:hypothetical protein
MFGLEVFPTSVQGTWGGWLAKPGLPKQLNFGLVRFAEIWLLLMLICCEKKTLLLH